jgi:hypothetical protein
VEVGDAEGFQALCSRLDLVLTDRLHGMVLALQAGTPAVVVDSIEGGAKVWAQAQRLEWPEAFQVQEATASAVFASMQRCLSGDIHTAIAHSCQLGLSDALKLDHMLTEALKVHATCRSFSLSLDGRMSWLARRIGRRLQQSSSRIRTFIARAFGS